MIYVFDTSGFVAMFKNYYRGRFPTLWQKFDAMLADGKIASTREVLREIEDQDDALLAWAKQHSDLFSTPTTEVGNFVAEIYKIPHFQANIEQKKILKGGKCADPFVVATAATLDPKGTVVTLEDERPNATKIPNICRRFGIPCLNLEQFMEQENWVF